MLKAKKSALRHGIAIVTIQRFWKQAGLFAEAVRQVLAIKRIYTNPFRACETTHDLLKKLRFQCQKLYDRYDPRAGTIISLTILILYTNTTFIRFENFKYVI